MSERIWDKFLTDRDKLVFKASGWGAPAGFGKRPAIVVIDVNWAFCSEKPEPVLEALKRWRTSCGEAAWKAMPYIKSIVEKAREREVPVIYTTGAVRPDRWDSGGKVWKNSRSGEGRPADTNVNGYDIVTDIAPEPQDLVIYKQKPSGFFGTNMASYLTLLGCDSLIVMGTATSGCVRATVLDAFSLNYRVALAEEGCFDRIEACHAVNLCDMDAKYADVVKTAEILAFLDTIEKGQYNLPKGAPVSPPNLMPKLAANF